MQAHHDLAQRFRHRWTTNSSGGALARAARWRVFHLMLCQRLGFQLWADVPLFFGPKMSILTGEVVSKNLLAFGYSEVALTALMLEILGPGMRVVDVGAHLGYEAMLASHLVGHTGRVVTFEPQGKIAAKTELNLRRFPQARLVRAAVGDYRGEIDFSELDLIHSAFSGAGAPKSDGATIQVPITTLTEALDRTERPVDFIKCDVEGGEMAVLRGAGEVLRDDQPILVLEAEMPTGLAPRPRVQEFEAFLKPLGYQGISFDFDGELRAAPLGQLDCAHANVAFVPLSKKALLSNNMPA